MGQLATAAQLVEAHQVGFLHCLFIKTRVPLCGVVAANFWCAVMHMVCAALGLTSFSGGDCCLHMTVQVSTVVVGAGSPGRLGRPSSSEVQTVSASPLGSPFGLRGPQSWPPGPQSSPSYNAAGAGPTSQASPGSYQGGPGSNGELVPALRSSGAYGAATPPDLVEAGPQGPEPEVRPGD